MGRECIRNREEANEGPDMAQITEAPRRVRSSLAAAAGEHEMRIAGRMAGGGKRPKPVGGERGVRLRQREMAREG